jgi:hypothetical protein
VGDHRRGVPRRIALDDQAAQCGPVSLRSRHDQPHQTSPPLTGDRGHRDAQRRQDDRGRLADGGDQDYLVVSR